MNPIHFDSRFDPEESVENVEEVDNPKPSDSDRASCLMIIRHVFRFSSIALLTSLKRYSKTKIDLEAKGIA